LQSFIQPKRLGPTGHGMNDQASLVFQALQQIAKWCQFVPRDELGHFQGDLIAGSQSLEE